MSLYQISRSPLGGRPIWPKRLGYPPMLTYASHALCNWRRIDPDGPLALGNLTLIQNFLGGMDEE